MRWMPGMRAAADPHDAGRVVRVDSGSITVSVDDREQDVPGEMDSWPNLIRGGVGAPVLSGGKWLRGWLPDLTDPATVGCLLALVREAWGNPEMGPAGVDGRWAVALVRENSRTGRIVVRDTEAAALVAALDAAP